MEQIAADIVELYRPLALQKSVHIAWESSLPAQSYLVDRKVLVSVLDNLFANAVKFTTTGHAKILLSHDNYGNVAIKVVDTGIGLSPRQQANLFDEFEQAGPRIARKYGGTGLGMAMVRRLIELMDGDIDLSSQQGHGTTFTITLPLEYVERKMTRMS